MSDEIVNVGIVGMGKMGILHTGILNSLENVEIKAIADQKKLIPNFVKNIMPSVGIYDEYVKMFNNEDLDLVYITTPTASHPIIAEECVKRGLNFFVEKPLSTASNDCINLIETIRKKSVVNMVGYNKHFVDTFKKAKEIIDSAVLGDVIYINSSMYVSQLFKKGKGWRYKKGTSGGGVLNILATHLIDVLIWFFGDISSVNGNIKSYYSKDVEDFVHSYLVFKNGLEGYLDASWSMRNYRLPEVKIEVHGDNGMIIVTDDYVKLYLDENSKWTIYYKQDLYGGVDLDIGGPEYTREDKYMVESVRNKKNMGIDVLYAFKIQKITDAIYESAYNKKPIGIDYKVV